MRTKKVAVKTSKEGHIRYGESTLCLGEGKINKGGIYGELCPECCEIASNLLQGLKLHEEIY